MLLAFFQICFYFYSLNYIFLQQIHVHCFLNFKQNFQHFFLSFLLFFISTIKGTANFVKDSVSLEMKLLVALIFAV